MSMYCIKFSVWIAAFSTLFVAFGQDGGKPAPGPGASFGGFLPMMLVMFAAVYFLMIRPEQKKQKNRQAMLNAVKKGDRVLTSAGMLGTVGTVKESTIMVKIAENTVVEFTKSAVTAIVNKDGSEKQIETEKKDK